MTGTYNPEFVALSLIVAIFASYTALELAGRVSQKQGRSSGIWLLGGAFAMGTGIWSMHFIGMLAFHLPIPVAYDTAITTLSLLIAILVSGLALYVASRETMSGPRLAASALLMGGGIAAMHYTGMAAMRMFPAISYQPFTFIASIIIAVLASFVALWIAFQLRHQSFGVAMLLKVGSAVVMGGAISGMHYTGMAAAHFAPGSYCRAAVSTGMSTTALALIIGIATFFILTIALGVSALDAHFAKKLATALQATNEQLSTLALYDSLTGLPNRMLLDDRMGEAASRAERSKAHFALLFVDLDRFKPVNDSFGHRIGDLLLKSVAERLIGCVRASDTVARTGGDEFVVVLSGIGDPKDAAMVSSKILDELSRPFFIEDCELDISGSIGISIYPNDGRDINTLKINADLAMYQAKRSGRNNYRFFSPDMAIPS
ncbi:MHYT domain-containing protein [Solimonas terrae]|uniref:Diguanylate cyclase n=1 Tax=Solimonas terrae TaxID=1396819 RepID=A0A6M2BW21_9GAMM|nr:MHYT domain-containing protein [Solimonas terrae]NGY06842.1 diguanylate cyclase [Solimonas terrae]